MKNRLYLLLFVVLFGSCDKFVDILPKGKNIPRTVDDLAKILNSNNNIGDGGLNWFYMTDDAYLSQEEMNSSDITTMNAYLWEPYMYALTEKDSDWATHYMIIYYANYVVEHIQTADEGVEFNRAETYGRALLHRAYSYWYLVSAYAPFCTEEEAKVALAVPMPLVSDINAQYPQSTVEKVYGQIFKDIETALALEELPEWRKYNSWPCKAAGYALLSRIYLYQKNWELAADNAAKVLAIDDFLTDYNEIEMNSPGNAAKGLKGYEQYAINDPEVILSKAAGNNFTDVMVSQELIDIYDQDKDLRFRYCFSDSTSFGQALDGYMRVNDNQTFDGIRMSEVYLNGIEALVRMGGTDNIVEARRLLDILRSKRYENPDALPEMSQEALLEEVLKERHRELRFTCFRWFDMKRLAPEFGISYAKKGLDGSTVTLAPDSHRYTWAIPLDVMEYNSQLLQHER